MRFIVSDKSLTYGILSSASGNLSISVAGLRWFRVSEQALPLSLLCNHFVLGPF